MSLKDLGFKGWAAVAITAIWLVCNLNFPDKEAAEPYFKIHNIENTAEQIADKRFSRAEARQERSRRYFWNKHKAAKEIKREVVGGFERQADEELYLGFVPKKIYSFLADCSVKSSIAAWKGVIDGEHKIQSAPANIKRGFWTPIIVLVALVLCLLCGGNVFGSLRRQLKTLPEVDAPADDEEDGDEENEEDGEVESNEEDE